MLGWISNLGTAGGGAAAPSAVVRGQTFLMLGSGMGCWAAAFLGVFLAL